MVNMFARTPNGVRIRVVPICATEPGRPNGLPITAFVANARSCSDSEPACRAGGLGSPGWSAATPWGNASNNASNNAPNDAFRPFIPHAVRCAGKIEQKHVFRIFMTINIMRFIFTIDC